MSAIWNAFQREPLVWIGAVLTFILGAVAFANGQGLISDNVNELVQTWLGVDPPGLLWPMIALIVGRFIVYSPATVANLTK